jgi:lysozyme
MNRQAIEGQLKIDEGIRLATYADSVGKLTIGIGHLIIPTDHILQGDAISPERCEALFKSDLDTAIAGAKDIFPKFNYFSDNLQGAIVNLVFNLGTTGLKKFKKFVAAINDDEDETAAKELENSKWYAQVGNRAKRIVEIVRGCATPYEEEEGYYA